MTGQPPHKEVHQVPKKRSPILSALLVVLPLIFFLLVGTVSCSSGGQQLPSLVFFQSDVCPYCKEMKPLVDQIRSAHRGELKVVYATLEDERGKELADQHGILGFPVVLLLDAEGERANLLRGVVPQPTLEQAVTDLIDSQR